MAQQLNVIIVWERFCLCGSIAPEIMDAQASLFHHFEYCVGKDPGDLDVVEETSRKAE